MREKYYDLIGVYSAFLCLAHCILGPILFIVPLGISHSPLLDSFFLIVGLFPVYKVVRSKSPVFLKILLVFSFALIALSITLEALYHQESFLIFIGAMGVISSHLMNYNYKKHEL